MSINPSIRIEQVRRLRALADAMKDIPDNASTMDDLESWLKHYATAEAAQKSIDAQSAYLKAVKDMLIASLAENRRKLDKALDASLKSILTDYKGEALQQKLEEFAVLSKEFPEKSDVSNSVAKAFDRNLLQEESEFHRIDIWETAIKALTSQKVLPDVRKRLADKRQRLQRARTQKMLIIAGGFLLASLIFFILAFVVYAKKQCAPAIYLQNNDFCTNVPGVIAQRPTNTPIPTPIVTPAPPPTAIPTATLPPTHPPTLMPTDTPVPTSTPTYTPMPTPTPTTAVGALKCTLHFGVEEVSSNLHSRIQVATPDTDVVMTKVTWSGLSLTQSSSNDCTVKSKESIASRRYHLKPEGEMPSFLQFADEDFAQMQWVEGKGFVLTQPFKVGTTDDAGELTFTLTYEGDSGERIPVNGISFKLTWNKVTLITPTPIPSPTPKPQKITVELVEPMPNASLDGEDVTFRWRSSDSENLPKHQLYSAVFFECDKNKDPLQEGYGFTEATKDTFITVSLVGVDDIYNGTPIDFKNGTWCWTILVGHYDEKGQWAVDYRASDEKRRFTYTRPSGSPGTNDDTGESDGPH